ncbi:hypothetical protein AeMF1_004645 [Aphanomyces euteiches]|nr:hypothetical protein AeMF1_004645 [Aphanomyces euteiches]KAH9183524.1 hypothetical protein AeNC1_014497 [Aphanomyces euteiches]
MRRLRYQDAVASSNSFTASAISENDNNTAPFRTGRIEWRAFLNLQREQNKSIVEQEVQMFQEKSATERQVQAKLKHYMVASNDQQDVDKSLWTSMSPKF